MKVSMNLLKQYADIPVTPAEYESRMIMTGTGVEGIEDLGEKLQNVVVGKVLTCEPHPNSDHLHVCTVDVGQAEPLQIVCGAPNVAAGQLVPVAMIGAVLPDGTIKKGKLRGVESYGMICSGPEMGVPVELYPSVGDEGILVFREDHPLGTDVREIFGLNDHVIDFEILANRPDTLCVWGVARETAAAMGTELKLPEINVQDCGEGSIGDFAKVDVLDHELCPRYTARVIKNVRVGESPAWLRQALHAAGMRSINNIVDITNFVMLETGHPMHAFDLSKVSGSHIIVRRAEPGEILRTLDGKDHTLKGGELLICDEKGPTGLAGIMGGEESEITEGTATVLFEAAAFDRTSIRLTARSLGFRTESSGRFERGVSPATVLDGLSRACQLVNLLDAGDVVPGTVDIYPNPVVHQPVTASVARINQRAGVQVSGEDMVKILKKLQFDVSLSGDTLTATAPLFRQDVEGEADLCEEVLRYAGYDLIPVTPLRGAANGGRSETMLHNDFARTILTGLGFYETMTFSFINKKKLELLKLREGDDRLNALPLRNPLGEDSAYMRTTLLCGALTTLSTNMAHGNTDVRLYELGKVFDNAHRTSENLPTERNQLCLCACGEKEDFYSLRGVVELLLSRAGVSYSIRDNDAPYFHPGRRASIVCGEKIVAEVGEIHPDVMETYELTGRAYAAVVDMEALFACAAPMGHVKPIARFPLVTRDLALVMQDAQPVGPVMEAMAQAAGKMLENISMFDVFRGIQVGLGNKSVAFSLAFRAEDHTLTDDEIQRLMNKVLKVCKEQFDAEIRS